MNQLTLVLAVLLLSTFSFAQSTSHSSTPLEDALIANAKSIHEAQKTKNAELLKHTLSDDFVQVGSEGHLHPRSEFVDEAREGELKDYNLYNFKVYSVDENTAIVTYNAIIQMPEGDTGAAPRYQIFSDLWIKDGENWKLKFQQATPLRSID
jgi:hypothetical protein